jgi:membrane protein implicated in regulation of membrane protease activity
MTLSRLNRILEIFWWITAALSLIAIIILVIVEGADKWAFYFLVPLFAVFAALMRRFAAKRLAKSEALKNETLKNERKN